MMKIQFSNVNDAEGKYIKSNVINDWNLQC